jgi:hypothetical protein
MLAGIVGDEMDKAEFVARAPAYYALAITKALNGSPRPLSEYRVKHTFPDTDEQTGEEGSLIDRWMIWERAVAWLLARDMIKIKYDAFGPPIFSKGPSFQPMLDKLTEDEDLPFSSFVAAGEAADWLLSALHSLENHYVNLDLRAEDFENPDSEWAPIKIEADDPTVKDAVVSLQNIIEEVRSDNGYAATHPHERDYVLEGLQGTLDKFESSSISAGYVRIAMERLGTVGRRFSGTVKDGTIAAAKAALVEFAKRHFGDALNYLWKWLF